MWLNKLDPNISFVLLLIIIFIPTIYGSILLYRYSQPFRLFKATTMEKWGWAAKAVFFLFLPYLLLGLFFPIHKPDENTTWREILPWVGVWIAVYLFLVIGQMVRFGFDISIHKWTSKNIRRWRQAGLTSPFPAISLLFPGRETRRFFREGLPDEIVEGELRNLQELHKEKPVYQSSSPENDWYLNIYGPAKKSPVFYAYFKNNLHSSEEYLFPFGFLEKPDKLSVFWNLPNHVCGLYITDQCYALFYYGNHSRPIGRYRARTKPNNYLSQDAITWFSDLGRF